MKKKNKAFTVNDFIIFLKAKIAIIMLSTLLLSLIAGYFQITYKDHWEVKLSRTVNNNSLMETIILIKNQTDINSKKYKQPLKIIDPIKLMREIHSLIASAMINYLSNEDILYTGLTSSTDNSNLLRKEIYELKITNENIDNLDILKNNLDKFIFDTNKLTKDIIRLQYGLNPTYSLEIYNFKVNKIIRVTGYDYQKILKIILISLIVSIFFIFIFHIRKSIKLF